jgi:1-deoxy-D-xylulose-5-phosphate reductoisomerase
MSNKKRISILGSTGSIGRQTLEVVRSLKDQLIVTVLAAGSNIDLLEAQAKEFSPKLIAVFDEDKALELKKRLPQIPVVGGMQGLMEAASFSDVDVVLSAIMGSIGIRPTIEAIRAGKTIALANKEVLVAAGEYVMQLAKEKNVAILPVDSEHSALFQCLRGSEKREVSRLILTASGGPFYRLPQSEMGSITLEKALKHPTWTMGSKVTIDSSTLMNKGLEVIEAHHLFQMPVDKIEVVVHPQSIIHSMVEFIDGSMLAQMSQPTMVVPIQYALTYPARERGIIPPFDFTKHPMLEFIVPEERKFICLELAFEALRQGGSLPCYLNAANEVLVQRFLEKQISWLDISRKLEKLCLSHRVQKPMDLERIFAIDAQAREEAKII